MKAIGTIAVFAGVSGSLTHGVEVPKEPVPKSPYIAVVYSYADTMLEHGRDRFGPQKTGSFLSALDRKTLEPLTTRPAAPAGLSEDERAGKKDGPLTGSNPQHDENLLRLLFTVSELRSKPVYRQAAEAGLKWFLENAASPATQLLPWGERMSWDVVEDKPIAADGAEVGKHEFFRPWMLWDQCFQQAPDASGQFALGLWNHQIADRQTGTFDSRAGFSAHQVSEGNASPRHAGFYIRTWAVAYAHTKNEEFLTAISVLLDRYEKRRDERTGLIGSAGDGAAPRVTPSLAIDCAGAAHRVPEPLASRLRLFAACEDAAFCGLEHDLKGTGGFVTRVARASGLDGARTPMWDPRSGGRTTAQVAMMCVSRYDNTGNTAYRELIHAAADAYLNSTPGPDDDVWPGTFGHAISLELAAWRSTARKTYLDRARQFGDIALERFFDNGPLPRASLKSDHYESVTGADTLALALTELHLHVLHITAVRCPPNTIDR
jgi:Periplasmic pectate lyase